MDFPNIIPQISFSSYSRSSSADAKTPLCSRSRSASILSDPIALPLLPLYPELNTELLFSRASENNRAGLLDEAHQIYQNLVNTASRLMKNDIPAAKKIFQTLVKQAIQLEKTGSIIAASKIDIAMLEAAYYFELDGDFRSAECLFLIIDTNPQQPKLSRHIEAQCGIERSMLGYNRVFDRIKTNVKEPGRVAAQCFIGMQYLNSEYGVECSPTKALNYFISAASQGCELATTYIQHLSGMSEFTDPEFNYKLGLIHFYGKYGIKQNDVVAVSHFLQTAMQWRNECDRHSNHRSGLLIHEASERHKQAISYLKKIANMPNSSGYSPANYGLFELFSNGCGVTKSDLNAVTYLANGASTGDKHCRKLLARYAHNPKSKAFAVANRELGYLYINGIGVATDAITAVNYFSIAAGRGDKLSKNYLEETADIVLCMGYAAANFELGVMYFERKTNFITENSHFIAATYFFKAARQGHEKATLFLVNLAQQTDLMEYPTVNYYLAQLYEEGCGVKPDYAKSLRHLTRSARAGYPEAIYWLGELYESGNIDFKIYEDHSKAIAYFKDVYVLIYDCVKHFLHHNRLDRIEPYQKILLGNVAVKLAIFYEAKHKNRSLLTKPFDDKYKRYWDLALKLKHPHAINYSNPAHAKKAALSSESSN